MDKPHRANHAPIVVIAASILMLAFVGSASAQKIYKWVDENGKTHYGDSAPTDLSQTQEINVRKTPRVDASVNTRKERTERLLESFQQERTEKRDQRLAAAAEKKERTAKCKAAQESQYTYKHSAFLYTQEDDGERVILNDEQYADALAKAQADVDEWCGK